MLSSGDVQVGGFQFTSNMQRFLEDHEYRILRRFDLMQSADTSLFNICLLFTACNIPILAVNTSVLKQYAQCKPSDALTLIMQISRSLNNCTESASPFI